jgi:flagellar hook-associated protein 3 FlgL
MTSISTLGTQLQAVNNLLGEQTSLNSLNQQLSTGQQFSDLTDYTPVDASNLLNFQNAINQRQGYLSAMQTVQARLSMYDTTMSNMENIAEQAGTLASQNQNLSSSNLASLQASAQNYLSQVQDDLNQQVGSRYVYAGVRYSTVPVTNLTSISLVANPPTTTTVSSPTLPYYDTEAVAGTPNDAAAYTSDTVTVDQNYNVAYGVSSDNPAFQQLINGLRYISAATTAPSAAAYQTDMTNASNLLAGALQSIQNLHASNASNQSTLTTETTTQNTDVTNLQNQISNIQQVNTAQVAAEIDSLQTQLQASYSATASLEQLSILKYL